MTKLTSLEALEIDGFVPANEEDKKEIELLIDDEIELSYDESNLKVYSESGIYVADIKKLEGHKQNPAF